MIGGDIWGRCHALYLLLLQTYNMPPYLPCHCLQLPACLLSSLPRQVVWGEDIYYLD